MVDKVLKSRLLPLLDYRRFRLGVVGYPHAHILYSFFHGSSCDNILLVYKRNH